MSDDAKKVVLARRARFVAAAIAGISMGCGKDRAPAPCLEIAAPRDAATREDAGDVGPQPCLSEALPRDDEIDAASSPPQPCLSIAPPKAVDAGPRPKK